MTAVTCGAGTGTSFLQSYDYVPYQPGKSQLAVITFVMGTGVANVTKDVGYFDAANGIFLRQNGASGLQIICRSSTSGGVVDTEVEQASWNLDVLDGTGTSRQTLDITKAQIMVIDLQFLGMGRVRVGFDIDGIIVYVHEFLNANSLTVPYMQTASLPIQVLVTASGSGSSATAHFKCAAVNSEGGIISDYGYTFATPEATATAGSGSRVHILSLRPLTTFGSKTNRTHINGIEFDIFVTGAVSVFYEIVVGAAFSVAPTYASVNSTYSSMQYGTAGTFDNLTNGIVIDSGYIPTTGGTKAAVTEDASRAYPITLDRAGAVRALGTMSLLVSGIGATSATRASAFWSEVR